MAFCWVGHRCSCPYVQAPSLNILTLQRCYYLPFAFGHFSLYNSSTKNLRCFYINHISFSRNICPSIRFDLAASEILIRSNVIMFDWPCHGSGGSCPASHRGVPRSRPGQFMWDLWWTKWHWGRFFSEFFDFPCQ
jgi:hypothetical protein